MMSEDPFHLDYELLELYVDDKADDIDREIVDSHVAQCSQCADELRDLLAFKEQPAASSVIASRWKKWFPKLPWLPKPVLAMVLVIAVAVLAMAVLWWTKFQTSPQGHQAQI